MVLEREGLRLHRARGRRGRLRSPHRDHDGGLPVADRGATCRVRRRRGPEGPAGGERPGGLRGSRNRQRTVRGPRKGPAVYVEGFFGTIRTMSLTTDEVLHVARLARLALTDEEVERFRDQLSAILEAVGTVGELDLSD